MFGNEVPHAILQVQGTNTIPHFCLYSNNQPPLKFSHQTEATAAFSKIINHLDEDTDIEEELGVQPLQQ